MLAIAKMVPPPVTPCASTWSSRKTLPVWANATTLPPVPSSPVAVSWRDVKMSPVLVLTVRLPPSRPSAPMRFSSRAPRPAESEMLPPAVLTAPSARMRARPEA